MIFYEPVQAAIWQCLNHHAYADAVFAAERLYAEVANDDALYLLATCYYHASRPIKAYTLLKNKGCMSTQSRLLFAQCCIDLSRYAEAEAAITGNLLQKQKSIDDVINEFGDVASFVLRLLALIYSRTQRSAKSVEVYRRVLKLNPFLWSAFEALCSLGDKPDPVKSFALSPSQNVLRCSQPVSQSATVINEAKEVPTAARKILLGGDTQHVNVLSQQMMTATLTPADTVCVTPESSAPQGIDLAAAPKTVRMTQSRAKEALLYDCPSLSPMTPSFGVMPLELMNTSGTTTSTVGSSTFTSIEQKPAVKRVQVSSSRQSTSPLPAAPNRPTVFAQSGINASRDLFTPSPQLGAQSSNSNQSMQLRRSSRLFGSSAVKENNNSKGPLRKASPKAPTKKLRNRMVRIQEEENMKNERPETKASSTTTIAAQSHLLTLQKQSADGFTRLLQDIGRAYAALSQYDCAQAVELFAQLPLQHYNTGWVLTQVGRAFFEMADYPKAEKVFEKVRQLEPHYMDGMEIYSTTLWHLQRDILLSRLAQELTAFDKLSPQAWCAAGNCFSLQKEHDTAIKFFQRAIQVDPNFAYAYTLLGHEYLLVEDLDKASTAYCNSIRVDSRHYNARYGMGMIYYKQEQFAVAEVYFRQALAINPNSSVLLCHIGMVQHALRKSDLALRTLQRAADIDPQNPLCKFHKASILFASDRLKEALKELEELKLIVPKESLVYFLLGKVHKKLGNTHLALMNFSYASDLDPKGTNNQIKEAINKHYVTDEDEVPVGSASMTANAVDVTISSNSSVVEPDDILLNAMESDESL